MKIWLKVTVVSAVMAAVLWGCGDHDSNGGVPAAQRHILESAVEHIVIPNHLTLQNRLETLQTQVDNFCSVSAGSRTAEELSTLQTSWMLAMDAWTTLQVVRFGPVKESNRQLSVQFWPDPGNKVSVAAEQIVASTATIDEIFIAASTVQSQGLPLMEYLLFAGTVDDPLADLNSIDGTRRCDLLSAVNSYLHTTATTLHQRWTDSYASEVTNPGNSGEFADEQEAIDELVNSMVELLQVIQNNKLADPLGETTPNPEAAESYRSQHSLNNIIKNLEGLREIYRGGSGYGFDDYLRIAVDQAIVDAGMEDLIQQSISAAQSISMPLTLAVSDSDQKALVQVLEQQILTLTAYIENDFATAMDASLGFNANDGD